MAWEGDDAPATLSRASFFGGGHDEQKRLWIGAKAQIRDYTDENGRRLNWNATPSDAELQELAHEVEDVLLYPSPYQIRKPRLPPYLGRLTRAWFLDMPVPLLTMLRADTLPALRTMRLNFHEHYTDWGKQVPRWPKDLVLPNLRGLIADPDYVERWPDLQVRATNVPSVQFLEVRIDRGGKALEAIAELGGIRHLNLANVRNHSGLFAAAPAGLGHLHINGTGRDLSIAGITRLTALRSLALWNARCEIDCRILAKLPRLEQLSLFGSSKLTHVGALLKCPELAWLWVVACKEPFKGPLAKRFEARGFIGFSTESS